MTAQVHWHEGLFLQPHHLQAMQRSSIDRASLDRALARPYPYGVAEAKLSRDGLDNMRVRFDRLLVVMPSGVVLDYPNAADLPALDIEEEFNASTRPFTVSLGVPLHYPGRANAIELGENADWRTKRMYRVFERDEADENTGENAQPVMYRKLNARLMLDRDDRTDMEVLPLLRVAHATGEDSGVPRMDPEFVPACLVLEGSGRLRQEVLELGNQIEATRRELVNQMTRGGFNVETMKGIQIQSMLKLLTLNRAAARLPALVQASRAVSPFEVYLEMRDCLSGLAALFPDKDPWEVPAYDHDNPAPAFLDLTAKIRTFLKVQDKGSYLMVQMRKEGDLLVCDLTDEHATRPNEYFLGVKTNEDPRQLAELVENPNEFKLIPKSLANTRLYGVRLKEVRHAPAQLPSPVGLNYFRIERAQSQRAWDRIMQEKQVALKFPGSDQGRFESVAIYMTVPN
ncbi:MAG: type VI secretion system baseplate subunit TssK [Phycisphaerales bacterium]|nr:type VI secretion system baseplate subunit TssK [Phycisphaerales bacterium]